mmetsp:Transcript_73575/g.238085  ORF Transcript_73575/g.238085 Transcript_73575/m.238085 type:complete len:812 (-) Transcript_73575:282-2717(-)
MRQLACSAADMFARLARPTFRRRRGRTTECGRFCSAPGGGHATTLELRNLQLASALRVAMGTQQSCTKTCSKCTADCARSANACGDDFDEERPGGDPAGAIFEETLEDLNGLDRQMMQFCASSNLAAVRWLLHLGAHHDSCDSNGTTCLHVACRAGALSVVRELLRYPVLLSTLDSAGWTPLHIAVLMGRPEVVVRLLQAGATVDAANCKGQVPSELCADSATYEAIRSYELHQHQSPGKPWQFQKEHGPGEDIVGSRLQYEPFFVPRQPVVRSQQYKKEFQRIGMLMFNRQPGFGLAFLVAAGVTRDYPVDMSSFLRRSKVDIRQVGSFLGEAFSLSHTIRLEFINSVVLQGTGVVSGMIQVFHMLQLPDDLQKINRLVHGVARIWWRQHERLQRDLANGLTVAKPRPVGALGSSLPQLHLTEELTGLELKQYLTSSDALHQLMFSTVLLHWYVYRDGSLPKRELDYTVWRRLNANVEQGGGDVPEHVQREIHALIHKTFIPELAVMAANRAMSSNHWDAAGGGADEAGGHGPDDIKPYSQALTPYAAVEGWVQFVSGGFPRPQGLGGIQTVTYKHVSSIFSEVTHTASSTAFGGTGPSREAGLGSLAGRRVGALATQAAEAMPATISPAPGFNVPGGSGGLKREDHAWLSLCYTLLFFSATPQMGFPYAFVELRRVAVASLNEESRVLTLVGASEPEESCETGLADAGGDGAGGLSNTCREGGMSTGQPMPVNIVLLLPDGRWQEMSLPKLELCVPSREDLQMWSMHLMAACQGKVPKPVTPSESTSHTSGPRVALAIPTQSLDQVRAA